MMKKQQDASTAKTSFVSPRFRPDDGDEEIMIMPPPPRRREDSSSSSTLEMNNHRHGGPEMDDASGNNKKDSSKKAHHYRRSDNTPVFMSLVRECEPEEATAATMKQQPQLKTPAEGDNKIIKKKKQQQRRSHETNGGVNPADGEEEKMQDEEAGHPGAVAITGPNPPPQANNPTWHPGEEEWGTATIAATLVTDDDMPSQSMIRDQIALETQRQLQQQIQSVAVAQVESTRDLKDKIDQSSSSSSSSKASCWICIGIVLVLIGVSIAIGVVVSNKNRNDSIPFNINPVARCQAQIVVQTSSLCEPQYVSPKIFDNGSSDANTGDTLTMSLEPSGPYAVGVHTLTLTVEDGRNGIDSCQTKLVVMEQNDNVWHVFQSHAYKKSSCDTKWSLADQFAKDTTLCGVKGHLVTITSEQELLFVNNNISNDNNNNNNTSWIGGFQPPGSTRPNEGWRWVNKEGLLVGENGFVNWAADEPNDFSNTMTHGLMEDCIEMNMDDGKWNDAVCSASREYIVEVDFDSTVVVEGCDSGVADIYNITSCEFIVAAGIAACKKGNNTAADNPDYFDSCLKEFLNGLVGAGLLSAGESETILNCGADNQDPFALCKHDVVQMFTEPGECMLQSLNATDLDDGSYDPERSPLRFVLSPDGPYPLGMNSVTLTVEDGQGGSDSCETEVMVIEEASSSSSSSSWRLFRNHAYRAFACPLDWATAESVAAATELCGSRGHLATISSLEENSVVGAIIATTGEPTWIGAFQPEGSVEPDQGWSWVNGEGSLSDGGFVNWQNPQPNNLGGFENCLSLKSGGVWNDDHCSRSVQPYVVEVEFPDTTVVGDSCDSGVPDFYDIATCSYTIMNGISACGDPVTNPDFAVCLDTFLSGLVGDGFLSNEQSQAIRDCDPGNQAPVAQCPRQLEITAGADCQVASLEISSIDEGSFDPDGDQVQVSIAPEGPYRVGVHNITLTVDDGRGGIDICQTLLVVKESSLGTSSLQMFRNHAYKMSSCFTNWQGANYLSSTATLCGVRGHLVTITSQEESDFFMNFVAATNSDDRGRAWIGAFQPHDAPEPDGGWMWVNDEGLIKDGFLNWMVSEPNDQDRTGGKEDCMITRHEGWNDADCNGRPWPFVTEFDFADNVMVFVGGCDSGVVDFFDTRSCEYSLTSGIAACGDVQSNPQFGTCVNDVLLPYVGDGSITSSERDLIMSCANQTRGIRRGLRALVGFNK